MFMLHKLSVLLRLLSMSFLTQLSFSNDFIDHLTKCTIRYTTQAEAWQTEPQQTVPRPPADTQKPSQFFFLKVRKLVRPPQCHLIKYFLTCYEHTDPFFSYIFYCQWFDNLAIAFEIKRKQNLNTDYYLATCPQVNGWRWQPLSVQTEWSLYLKAIPQTNKRNVLQVLGSVLF